MVENTEVKTALENRTEFNEVFIEGLSDQFVYAMVSDNTGMKFELHLEDGNDVAYLVWEDNDQREQDYVADDLDAIVKKANTIHNKYFA